MLRRGAAAFGEEFFGGEAVEGGIGVTDAGIDVGAFADFEMEVGEVEAVGGADFADLFAAMDELAGGGEDLFEVGIDGLDDFLFAGIFEIGDAVGEDEHVAPALSRDCGEDDAAFASGVDGVAKIGVFAADAVEVVA